MVEKTLKSDFLDTLIYSISHDLGMQLRHVVAFSKMLASKSHERLTEEEMKWLEIVCNGGEHSQRMLEALNIFPRLVTSKLECSEVELSAVFEKVLSVCRRDYDESEAQLVITGEWPTVDGYMEHWRIIFRSLLDNALLFHQKEDRSNAIVNVHCEETDGLIQFVMEDSGIGVPEEQRLEILKPFKRLNKPETYPGLGMGLSYCHYIAQLNNGALTFSDSTLGGLKVVYSQPVKNTPTLS